jgi:MFS transporter, DHA2 family, multidrug resistance protein
VLQQVRFELFAASALLIGLTLAAALSLGWFVWHQWHADRPLVKLQPFAHGTFRVGLALFALYYYLNGAFSYLIARFLEEGLSYPAVNAGRLVGLTAALALPVVLLYMLKIAPLIPRKKWLIVAGFLLAALIAAFMSRLPPDTSTAWLVGPLLLRGLLLMFIVLPAVNITYGVFPVEEFTHSYRIKNIVRQMTISFATASMIVLEQHRLALHHTRLAEAASIDNPRFRGALDALTGVFAGQGQATAEAHGLALAEIAAQITRQASFLACLDAFVLVAAVALSAALFALLQRRID